MKRIFLILLCLLSLNVSATIHLTCTVSVVNGGSGTATTASTDATTGAGANKLVVVALSYYIPAGANVSDNLVGNTYIPLTAQTNGNMGVVIYYYIGTNVSSTMTWSTTSHFAGLNVAVFDDASTISFFSESGSNSGTNPITPGAITPHNANNVFVSVFGTFNGAQPTIPTGYSPIALYPTLTAEGGGAGYLIQSAATVSNPSWSGTGTNQVVALACFTEASANVNMLMTQ